MATCATSRSTQEDVVSCNDYPLLWNKDASEAQRRAELERKVRDLPQRRR